MSKSTNTKDEIAVWFDVNIGHSHCPDEETKENCKYTELTKLIDEQVQQAVRERDSVWIKTQEIVSNAKY